VRLVDHPANRHGRRYIVERELAVMAEVPAAGACCLLAELLQQDR
jgi:hypothetical protein